MAVLRALASRTAGEEEHEEAGEEGVDVLTKAEVKVS
jgi:hypothetical protein